MLRRRAARDLLFATFCVLPYAGPCQLSRNVEVAEWLGVIGSTTITGCHRRGIMPKCDWLMTAMGRPSHFDPDLCEQAHNYCLLGGWVAADALIARRPLAAHHQGRSLAF
jgi:hypothetical protein